ncbi:MAG: DUF4115 domain-containing protein, partial [Rhodobacteraceae bacterium]|nr:DUF4115 domain-containing protein [Paracoccaceae bacterium]
ADGGVDVLPNPTEELRAERLDRLYRPQALDVPVLVARDAPIATIDPRDFGNFAEPSRPSLGVDIDTALAQVLNEPENLPVPQVVAEVAPTLTMVAVRTSWVRVRAADNTVIFEATMRPGDSWEVPLTEEPPTLRTGESGAIYFAMDDAYYGPVGQTGQVTSNLALAADGLKTQFQVADITSDQGLQRYAEAQSVISDE